MDKNFIPGREKIIELNEGAERAHLGEMVRGTVEETLNRMLEAEADRLCNAEKYQRHDARTDTRAGHYQRKLHTRAGEVTLKVPKLRRQTFETAIIERYRRREASVEEALIEMYLAGVSVRRVEDITEALWGTKVGPATVSRLNKKVYEKIEVWRNRPISDEFPYVYLDGIVLKRSWAGEVSNVSVLVAIGVSLEGYRKILGVCEGAKEDRAGWSNFLRHLKERGLKGVRLFITDACLGLVESLGGILSGSQMAALHGAFLPQRLQRGAVPADERGGGHAQGHPRFRGQGGSAGQGRAGLRKAGRLQAQGGRPERSVIPSTRL